jgi:hypothetical protein
MALMLSLFILESETYLLSKGFRLKADKVKGLTIALHAS